MKRLVIVGASGMVGGYAFRYALEDPNVERVKSVGRRNLGISHSKLMEVLHPDFVVRRWAAWANPRTSRAWPYFLPRMMRAGSREKSSSRTAATGKTTSGPPMAAPGADPRKLFA
jgi:hypothetical protein